NRIDLAEKQEKKIDIGALSALLGVEVIASSAIFKGDIEKLKSEILKYAGNSKTPSRKVEYPNEVESVIERWEDRLAPLTGLIGADERWIALRLIENDHKIRK